jgi:hypothetical protein
MIDKINSKCSYKTCANATLPTRNPIRSVLELNPGLMDEVTADDCTTRYNALFLSGHAMSQEISGRLLIAKTRLQSQLVSCDICGGRSSTRKCFSLSTSVFSCE